jgi:hypothetical protein
MWNARGLITGAMAVLIASLPAASSESEPDAKAARLFKIIWSSVSYDHTISNPALPSDERVNAETLRLSVRVEFVDPNRVLGTCQEGVVTELVNGAGQDVNVAQTPQPPSRFYQAPRTVRRYTQPPQVPKWQAAIRSILKLPSATTGFRPQPYNEWQPNQVNLRLETSVINAPATEIRRVKGYFYALVPESMEVVDVPFEPNDTWVRLTDDLEIKVQEAACTGSSYQYVLQTHGNGTTRMGGPGFVDRLPSRMLTAQQLIGMDGKPISQTSGGSSSSSVGGTGTMSGSGSGLSGPIKALRFIIAVKPGHRRIPLEFEHIPLPKLPKP